MRVVKSLIFGNHERAFIRGTRPPRRCVTGLPCPNCGSELAFLEQYRRHYCYACGQYAPQGFGDEGAKVCPSCGGILSYVTDYNRYYCYRESAFPAEDADLKSIYDTVSNPSTQEASAEPTVLITEPPKVEEPAPSGADTPKGERTARPGGGRGPQSCGGGEPGGGGSGGGAPSDCRGRPAFRQDGRARPSRRRDVPRRVSRYGFGNSVFARV